MKTSEVLRKAKALIDTPEKWWQNKINPGGMPMPGDGIYGMCAGQAISTVCNDAYIRCSMLLVRCGAMPAGLSIPEWNDAPERTHDEVMEAFDKVAAFAEQEESASS